jgi:hypothetical protein
MNSNGNIMRERLSSLMFVGIVVMGKLPEFDRNDGGART